MDYPRDYNTEIQPTTNLMIQALMAGGQSGMVMLAETITGTFCLDVKKDSGITVDDFI